MSISDTRALSVLDPVFLVMIVFGVLAFLPLSIYFLRRTFRSDDDNDTLPMAHTQSSSSTSYPYPRFNSDSHVFTVDNSPRFHSSSHGPRQPKSSRASSLTLTSTSGHLGQSDILPPPAVYSAHSFTSRLIEGARGVSPPPRSQSQAHDPA